MIKSSEVISGRISKIMDGLEYDEFFRESYAKMFKECLDIADIEYYVTAVGILGKALENQIKEYFNKKVKNKTMFSINTGNYSIKKIREQFNTHFNRIKLLNGKEVKINGKNYKLKRSLLKDEDYNELLSISRARNDSFHGCEEERYLEIEAKSQSYIDRGVVIFAMLEKQNR
ncbi:TPA: hypothetical protein N2E03_003750 [Clostridium botulinum]|nr:hypothetical protein [Clostridium botulinum]HCL4561045.1 hypothetical protein [Clostridium botulinum]